MADQGQNVGRQGDTRPRNREGPRQGHPVGVRCPLCSSNDRVVAHFQIVIETQQPRNRQPVNENPQIRYRSLLPRDLARIWSRIRAVELALEGIYEMCNQMMPGAPFPPPLPPPPSAAPAPPAQEPRYMPATAYFFMQSNFG